MCGAQSPKSKATMMIIALHAPSSIAVDENSVVLWRVRAKLKFGMIDSLSGSFFRLV